MKYLSQFVMAITSGPITSLLLHTARYNGKIIFDGHQKHNRSNNDVSLLSSPQSTKGDVARSCSILEVRFARSTTVRRGRESVTRPGSEKVWRD